MKRDIKKYRIEKGLTLEELAEMVGLSKSYIDRIENNLENPTDEVIDDIALALGVCPKQFTTGCKFNINCDDCKLNKK